MKPYLSKTNVLFRCCWWQFYEAKFFKNMWCLWLSWCNSFKQR